MEKVFHKCKQFVQLVSLSQLNYMYLCSSHLVTSSTWCAQALFLRMGASPCQMTRICWGQNFCPITRTAEYENCWITRIRWVKWLPDNQDMLRTKNYKIPTVFQVLNFCWNDLIFGSISRKTHFSAFWRVHPHQSVLDPATVKTGHQAVKVSLEEFDHVSWCRALCFSIEFPLHLIPLPPPPLPECCSSLSQHSWRWHTCKHKSRLFLTLMWRANLFTMVATIASVICVMTILTRPKSL